LTSRFILETAPGSNAQHTIKKLVKELEQAKKHGDKGRFKQKERELQDYQEKVGEQIALTLTEAQADILIRLAQAL
jgi:hypothetical protein